MHHLYFCGKNRTRGRERKRNGEQCQEPNWFFSDIFFCSVLFFLASMRSVPSFPLFHRSPPWFCFFLYKMQACPAKPARRQGRRRSGSRRRSLEQPSGGDDGSRGALDGCVFLFFSVLFLFAMVSFFFFFAFAAASLAAKCSKRLGACPPRLISRARFLNRYCATSFLLSLRDDCSDVSCSRRTFSGNCRFTKKWHLRSGNEASLRDLFFRAKRYRREKRTKKKNNEQKKKLGTNLCSLFSSL